MSSLGINEVTEFQLGNSYQHASGKRITIVGAVQTFYFGWCFVAEEEGKSDLTPIGIGEGFAENWVGIPDWREAKP